MLDMQRSTKRPIEDIEEDVENSLSAATMASILFNTDSKTPQFENSGVDQTDFEPQLPEAGPFSIHCSVYLFRVHMFEQNARCSQ